MKSRLLNLHYLPYRSPSLTEWRKLVRRDEEFINDEPEVEESTDKPLFDEIVEKVCTENEAQKQSDNEEDNKSSSLDDSKVINSLGEFLSVLDQQKAFLKWHGLSTDLVEQQLVSMQSGLCKKQITIWNFFKISSPAHMQVVKDVEKMPDDHPLRTTIQELALG